MIVLIDNYDSFTYNLYQYLGELNSDIRVIFNDMISVKELIALNPSHLVISPGPGKPLSDSGVSAEAINYFSGKIPILGVCLGHQCIGSLYGAKVSRASKVMHGKMSSIIHNGRDIFLNIPTPFEAMRYHSLLIKEPLPSDLEIIATTPENEIMGIKHREFPTYGVQFHPESILTQYGKEILKNFYFLKQNMVSKHNDSQ